MNEFHYYFFPHLFRKHIKKLRFKYYLLEIVKSKKPIKEVLCLKKYLEYKRIVETTDLQDDIFEWITNSLNYNET